MSSSLPKCYRCHAEMVPGFTLDRVHSSNALQQLWVEGFPERGWFGLKIRKRKQIPVVSLRCTRCGVLESYARQ